MLTFFSHIKEHSNSHVEYNQKAVEQKSMAVLSLCISLQKNAVVHEYDIKMPLPPYRLKMAIRLLHHHDNFIFHWKSMFYRGSSD